MTQPRPAPGIETARAGDVAEHDYLVEPTLVRPRVPGWLSELGVREGEYFSGSKLSLRRLMTPVFQLKPRVWGCLYLHTNGFRSEIAYKRFKNQNVYLRPAEIATELYKAALKYYADAGVELTDEQKKKLRVSKQQVRRILAELENEGLCQRQTSSGEAVRTLPPDRARRLSGDDIRIVLFAVPRPPLKPPGKPNQVGINSHPTPKQVVEFIRLLKIGNTDPRVVGLVLKRIAEVAENGYLGQLSSVDIFGYLRVNEVAPPDSLSDEVREAFADYLQTEKVAAETLTNRLKVVAITPPYERTSEINFERNAQVPSSSSSSSAELEEHPATTTTTPPPQPQPTRKPPSPPEVPTAEEITFLQERTGVEDRSALKTMIIKCRQERPQITIVDIWELWKKKFTQLQHKQSDPNVNFIGLMITSIAAMAASP